MPSSYQHVIPIVCQVIEKQQPERVLDIGIGYGKYGMMVREYDQHLKRLDGVEAEPRYITKIQTAIYDNVLIGDIRKLPIGGMMDYDLVLFIDVIEHMEKEDGHKVLSYFLDRGAKVVVSTPLEDIPQHSEEFPFENHVSHWDWSDFDRYAYQRLNDPTGKAFVGLFG